ncbi:hypothetical protein CHS0354_000739 [Potamilus streckersoni]|uniref:glutamate synthase (ferredoxin) n=1 Tax=Potamilus streckersoni TaxID=2493646 RepID=A0AAE0T7W0_9BIVA|nr:hypothetical protein CHS0354_000739 [Potamilus streckersoni]
MDFEMKKEEMVFEGSQNFANLLGVQEERSACGVGFMVNLRNEATYSNLQNTLRALSCEEHRGGCSYDKVSSDGAGIMTDIPFELFGYSKGEVAVATLLIPLDAENQRIALSILNETFKFFDLRIEKFRDVPIDTSVLGYDALRTMPSIKQVFIRRPSHCRTDSAFNRQLYIAKQYTRLKASEKGLNEFYFASLSTNTIVYKALTRGNMLDKFYLDLQNPKFKTRFTIFHRRFSTNTQTSWDKAQPFRVIAHNGEINTISGNRSWGYSREKSLGLKDGELISHSGISDTGTLNEMAEALLFRSSIPHLEEILAIMMPPASRDKNYYKFWSRAMEAWDGPAFIAYSNGHVVGARLDRNGFRPCRWAITDSNFYLSSEAGSFEISENDIRAKGTLHAGTGVFVALQDGEISFQDPSESRYNVAVEYDPHLLDMERSDTVLTEIPEKELVQKAQLFGCTKEEVEKILIPMCAKGKEPIGSMGDTARPAVFSSEPRSLFDFFYQNFAQVTNPPVDYLREEIVTDLSVNLGRKANIFYPKELIPMPTAFNLNSPVLSLAEMNFLLELDGKRYKNTDIKVKVLHTVFKRNEGEVGFNATIRQIEEDAVQAAKDGISILVLSDTSATLDVLPVPSLLSLRAAAVALSDAGLRLKTSLVVYSADIRSTHHLATIVGFGATAVCPYFALSFARNFPDKELEGLDKDKKEKNLISAFEQGLLKIMSKMGISVARSYEDARLFSVIGLGPKLMKKYFNGIQSPVGGLELTELVSKIISNAERTTQPQFRESLINTYQYKELPRGGEGEKHSMTTARAKVIHKLARETGLDVTQVELYDEYLKLGEEASPVNLRHLFTLRAADGIPSIPLEDVQPQSEILQTFGSGGMSFGAISAESQRDIFLAMKEIGGRSNSGEGGENPYYFKDGIHATSKQVASGRFGVTAEYLSGADEIQIKVAQGAKPGEGGQLMSVKVDEHIAKARHAKAGIDLISPPPLHDIYSIEDLKQLIYELKQVNTSAKVCVKLVSGVNIGTIAVGVAKAGADVIHISGFDGGTGAASLSSMKHAGLPWEIGLWEVHRELAKNKLRRFVTLRTDGGFASGKDVVMAALLGAEEYDFGKLLLVAEGCIMARICELNTCPTGIATQDPKFKAKYKGNKDHVVKILKYIAEDARRHLAKLGATSLKHIIGRTDYLEVNTEFNEFITKRNLDLGFFIKESYPECHDKSTPFDDGVGSLNKRILQEAHSAILDERNDLFINSEIFVYDRGVMATLSGEIAKRIQDKRYASGDFENEPEFNGHVTLNFKGSAGQGFGVFTTKGITAYLKGEANDSVCKSMSGGKVVIVPPDQAKYESHKNVIIGNCALYGATGGTVYISGIAGDRFAVRNSGATAVVEGVGLHACEYMTDGFVVILGNVWHNLGAGMTGGRVMIYSPKNENNSPNKVIADVTSFVNQEYIKSITMTENDLSELKELLEDYIMETRSKWAKFLLENWKKEKKHFKLFVPIKEAQLAYYLGAKFTEIDVLVGRVNNIQSDIKETKKDLNDFKEEMQKKQICTKIKLMR